MIALRFENENGALRFGGGRSTFSYKIIEITGLSFLPKQYTINQYANVPGQIASGGIEPARTISLSIDVSDCDVYTMAKFNKILSRPGVLYIYSGSRQRKIKCRCEDFVCEKRRRVYQPMVIQFICDNPFFEDFEPKRVALYDRNDLIIGAFTLPCVFTERLQRINVVNAGQHSTEPTIFLYCLKAGDGESCSMTLINHTTGIQFTLQYKMQQGEEVCIDFANRKITSSMPSANNNNGDLIVYISAESYMSKFKLEAGVNDIECVCNDSGGDFTAVCEYTSKYIEAVM